MTMTYLRRDPFARATFIRFTLPKDERKECSWCGQPNGRFTYGWARDTDHDEDADPQDGRAYCSVQCWQSYNT